MTLEDWAVMRDAVDQVRAMQKAKATPDGRPPLRKGEVRIEVD